MQKSFAYFRALQESQAWPVRKRLGGERSIHDLLIQLSSQFKYVAYSSIPGDLPATPEVAKMSTENGEPLPGICTKCHSPKAQARIKAAIEKKVRSAANNVLRPRVPLLVRVRGSLLRLYQLCQDGRLGHRLLEPRGSQGVGLELQRETWATDLVLFVLVPQE